MARTAKPSAPKSAVGKQRSIAQRDGNGTRSPPRRRAGRVDAATVAEIFRRFAAANPHPEGELEHSNAYTLLVAVVLSAQATDAGVNRATRPLFEIADTPEKMVALGEERVREAIKTIGLYRNKAKNVIALSERLIAEHGGEVPHDREALESLPGVGKVKARRLMEEVGIADTRRVRGLGAQQRQALLEALDK